MELQAERETVHRRRKGLNMTSDMLKQNIDCCIFLLRVDSAYELSTLKCLPHHFSLGFKETHRNWVCVVVR